MTSICVAAFLAVVTACGGASPAPARIAPARPQPPAELTAYIPADAVGLIHARPAELTASPYFAALEPTLISWLLHGSTLAVRADVMSEADVRLLMRSEDLWTAQRRGAAGDLEMVFSMRGGPSVDDLEAMVGRLAAASATPVTRREVNGVVVIEAGNVRVARPHADITVGGSGASGAAVVALATGERLAADAAQIVDDPAFAGLCEPLACRDAALFAYAPLDDTARGRLVSESGGIVSRQAAATLHRVAVRVQATDGIDVLALADAADASAAANVAADVRGRTRALLGGMQGMMLRALGLAAVIEAFETSADGSRTRASLRLPDREVRALLARIDSLRGLAEGFGMEAAP